jgi:hypothetical protein
MAKKVTAKQAEVQEQQAPLETEGGSLLLITPKSGPDILWVATCPRCEIEPRYIQTRNSTGKLYTQQHCRPCHWEVRKERRAKLAEKKAAAAGEGETKPAPKAKAAPKAKKAAPKVQVESVIVGRRQRG